MATFFFLPAGLKHINEYPVLRAVGVTPMIYTLLLKYFAFLFLGMLLSSIAIVALCATDNYLNKYRQDDDPISAASSALRNALTPSSVCSTRSLPPSTGARVPAGDSPRLVRLLGI
jgi:hypothetical protein